MAKELYSIVLRTGIDVFRPILDKLELGVSTNCIKHISAGTSPETLKTLYTRPMFSSKIIVYASLAEDDAKYIGNLLELANLNWIQMVISVSNRVLYDSLVYDSRFKAFKFLDCYRVKNEVLERYIRYSLLKNGCDPKYITKTSITRIRRRARFRTYVLDSVLPVLAKTNLSQKVVESYIAPYTGVTLSNIGKRFFEPEKGVYVAKFLSRYRNYISNIFKSVKAYVESWLVLYDEYASGQLSEETALDWLDTRGEKFKIHYSYEVTAWLSSFTTYSYDFMLFVFMELQEATHENNNCQLLTLYRIFRMVNTIEQS